MHLKTEHCYPNEKIDNVKGKETVHKPPLWFGHTGIQFASITTTDNSKDHS